MELKKIMNGAKSVIGHPAVSGALQGAFASYIKDATKRRGGKGTSLLMGVGIGIAVGVGTALLFTTKGGKDLRAKLMKVFEKAATDQSNGATEAHTESGKLDGANSNIPSRRQRSTIDGATS